MAEEDKKPEETKEESPAEKTAEGTSAPAGGRDRRSGNRGDRRGGDRRGPRRERREPTREEQLEAWEPKTTLGKMVKSGQVKTMHQALETALPIREVEVVDILLPELDDEVLDVNMVQRMTDSGRRVRFAITTVVGNSDGYVGLGIAKGKEVGPAIRKSIDNAKLNIIEVKRGCGSWECGCKEPHSFPFQVNGKCSSVTITLKPSPKGVSLAVSEIPKKILKLAGVKDCWAVTSGQTRTTVNYSKAVFDALKNLNRTKMPSSKIDDFKILEGPEGGMQE